MIFLCDVVKKVSFRGYVLEVLQSWMRLCYKRQYFLLSASVVSEYTFSPVENDSRDMFLKTFIKVSSIL